MKMPDDFLEESQKQRFAEAHRLQALALKHLQSDANEWPVEFSAGIWERPCSILWPRAAMTASLLDDRAECSVDNLATVTFRPYPSKFQGAWRIEVAFVPHGPWSGKEWYVTEEQLWEAWEKAGQL